MSLSEAAAKVASPKAGGVCTVALALAGMDDHDRAILTGWLGPRSGRKSSWIAVVLYEDGVTVDGQFVRAQTIARHRRGDCDCR